MSDLPREERSYLRHYSEVKYSKDRMRRWKHRSNRFAKTQHSRAARRLSRRVLAVPELPEPPEFRTSWQDDYEYWADIGAICSDRLGLH